MWMREFLYTVVAYIAKWHERFLALNDSSGYAFSDKQLHFLVIGALGILLILLIQPVFSSLAKKGHVLAITWLYVTTLLIVLPFAIEIGQKVTNTGNMEFADIVFGLGGFFYMFAIFAIIRWIIILIAKAVKKRKNQADN